MKKVEKVFLIINFDKIIPDVFLNQLCEIINNSSCSLYVSGDTAEYLKNRGCSLLFNIIKNHTVLQEMDIAIVLGGDGSILKASTQVCSFNIPILGINFGTLGYMAELESSDIQKVVDVLDGSYHVEERMMLSAKIERADKSVVMLPPALNDIVLSNGPIARLLNFNVICNGVMIEKCRADGLIISTPTGSTAYSMSAGGPILAPGLNAFCLTPICPHSFGSRPVILNGNDNVVLSDIRVVKDNSVYLTLDGRLIEKVENGDKITVTRSLSKTSLVRLKDNSFLSVLNSKLQEV